MTPPAPHTHATRPEAAEAVLSPEAARQRLAEATGELRQAVTEGRYADAKELMANFSQMVAATKSPELALEAGEFIEWSRRLILARRAVLAGQIRQISMAPRSYVRSAATHTFDLTG
jgi:hypothetical protein